ncbi:MAG: stage II sporulation protein M [Cyclobacteriaceae bacterium]|nr:stage II sporulation protein M [Cyclobacteriaceae bacterium HetDA_MAG_MS6]
MKQALFVKINQSNWEDYEKKLSSPAKLSSEELSKIYVHLTEDLAFAKAKYEQTELTRYLNQLALRAHNLIYKNKPEEKSRIWRFWVQEVPFEIYRSYPQLLFAFIIMSVGILIGFLSSVYDDTFVRLIMGDGYVDMTLENIRKGDPMAVYKSAPSDLMFLGITINNIKVSIMAFAMGIFFSIGTGYVLFQNGVMLGAFHHLFFAQGLFDSTILTIWLHGTLEISAIVIAGAAGLVMGNSLLFPDTYPRLHSLKVGARRGLKIVIGLFPFFIVAGFIESFITRNTEWSLAAKVVIIAVSAFIVISYLFLLPYYAYRKHATTTD